MTAAILIGIGLIAILQAGLLLLVVLEASLRQKMLERAVEKALPNALRTITREWTAWAQANGASLDMLEEVRRGMYNNNFGLTQVIAFLEQQGFKIDVDRL